MKTLTRIISSLSLTLVMAFSAHAQNVFKVAPVGIGSVTPTQALDVFGNVKFSGALMPAGVAGTVGNILLSAGGGTAPTWLANSSSGLVLTSNGTAAPTWSNPYNNTWNLTGNTISAVYGTNFLGSTTSNLPLEFKVNNAYAGILDPVKDNVYLGNGGNDASGIVSGAINNVAIGQTSPAPFGGAAANASNNVFIGYSTGPVYTSAAFGSTAVGNQAMRYATAAPNEIFGAKAFFGVSGSTTGTNNLAFGYESENGHTSGIKDVAIGDLALFTASSSSYNTAVGYGSLYSTSTSSGDNTAVGYYAGYTNTTGANNTALGYYSLFSLTTGVGDNAAIGYYAGKSITTGKGDVGIGYEADMSQTATFGNVAIGYLALASNATGAFNAIGANAMKSLISTADGYGGQVPFAIGDSALTSMSSGTGIQENAIGAYALSSQTGAAQYSETAIGYGALQHMNGFISTGVDQANIGYKTMFNYTSETTEYTSNFSLGAYAYYGPYGGGVAAPGNTAIGFCALGPNSTGADNTAIGSSSILTTLAAAFTTAPLGSITSGAGNLAIGYEAGDAITSGSDNTAIGINAQNGAIGSGNVAVGYSSAAGSSLTTTSTLYTDNTALGASASAGIVNATPYNTAIGGAATAASATGTTAATSATALGYNASATANNATAIGANATANTANTVILGSGANVGIGTSNPGQELEIGGTVNTIRVDGIGTGGSFSSATSLSTDQVLFARSLGDVYSLPNGTNGQVLTNSSGIPTWSSPAAYTTSSPLSISGNSLIVSGTAGGVLYGTGTGAAFTAAGNPLNILTEDPTSGFPQFDTLIFTSLASHDEWGSQTVVTDSLLSSSSSDNEYTISGNGTTAYPLRLARQGASNGQTLAWDQLGSGWGTWKPSSANASLTTYNIVPATGSAITVAHGIGQVVGGSNVTLDIRGTSGGVLYGTGTGTSAVFSSPGTNGQVLTYSSGAPTWAAANPPVIWALTGNSGTTPGTNWFGTNDDKQLRFYSGSPYAGPAGSIDPQLVGGTAFANTYLGDPNGNNSNYTGAGNNDAGSFNVGFGFGAMGYAASTATYDVAMGSHALEWNPGSYDVTLGYGVGFTASSPVTNGFTELGSNIIQPEAPGNYSTGVGFETLTGYTGTLLYSTGAYNTTLGYASMYGSTGGASNTAIGTNALYSITVGHNTAVGDSALYSNTTGTYNTALGYGTNVTSTWTNATAIGYNASATASNSITLGNTAAHSLYIPGYNTIGSLYTTNAAGGLVSSLIPSTSGYLLESHGPGNVPTWSSVTLGAGTVTNVSGNAPIVVTGNYLVGIQGSATGADKGGILYSTGAGNSAAFTSTGGSGQVLLYNGPGAPTWGALPFSGWNLAGNAGTTAGTNFIGTLNDYALVFETASGDGTSYDNAGNIDPQYEIGSVLRGNVAMGEGSEQNANNGAGNFDAGSYNVAFGCATLGQNTTGVGNIAMTGFLGLPCNTTGNYNISLGGQYTMRYEYEGNGNIAAGYSALSGQSNTVSYNIGIGNSAGYEGNGGSGNYGSTGNGIGQYNVALGNFSLYTGGTSTNATSNTAIGNYADYGTTGNRNTGVGDSTLYFNTTGYYNTALGYKASVSSANPGLTNYSVIGYNAIAPVSNSVTLGNTAASSLYIPGYNTVGSLYYTNSNGLVSSLTPSATTGYLLESMGPGNVPVWASVNSVASTVTNMSGVAPITITGTFNVGIKGTAANQGGILYSAGSGTTAVFTSTGTSGQFLMSNGTGAPTWGTPTVSGWQVAGNAGTTAGTNFVGTLNNLPLVFETYTTGNGSYDDYSGEIDLGAPNGNGNTYMGQTYNASTNEVGGGGTDAGTYNVGIGPGALAVVTTGATGNVAVGAYDILKAITTGSYNVGMDYEDLFSDVTGNGNVGLGMEALYYQAGSVSYNTALGSFAGSGNTANGQYNVAFGANALSTAATVGVPGSALTYGNSNVAIGAHSLAQTSTGRNVAVGDSALYNNTTGSYNTALGWFANTASAALTNATAIGYQASAPVSNSITLGNTVANALYLPGYTSVGSLLYTSNSNGLVSSLVPSTSGYLLESQGTGAAPIWAPITPGVGSVTNVSGTAPMYVTGTWNVAIQGNTAGTDKGGVLYSAGSGTPALFTSTGTAGQSLQYNGASAPTWVNNANYLVWKFPGNYVASFPSYGTYFIGTLNQLPTNLPLEFKAFSTGQNYTSEGVLDNVNNNVYFGGEINTFYPGGETSALNAASDNVGIGAGAFGVPAVGGAGPAAAGGDPGVTNDVALGWGAMYEGLDAYSTAVGTATQRNEQGPAATSPAYIGGPNTSFGNFAMRGPNSGVGLSLTTTVTGVHNLAIGCESQADCALANYNVGIGDLTLHDTYNTAAAGITYSYNTVIGYASMDNIGTGNDNTAAGYEANLAITTGSYDVAVGYIALAANTTTGYNVALGSNALHAVVAAGNADIGIGANAAASTTASHNIAVGDSALYNNSTGQYNVAVGYGALTTFASGNGNTTGTYNTALGDSANVATTALTNTTTIGARAYASASNSIVLGEISGINGTPADVPTVNVGIGTNTPAKDAALAIKTNHLETQGSTGTNSAGLGVSSISVTGTDVGGSISFVESGSGGTGAQVTVTFAKAYLTTGPAVVIAPANAAAAAAMTTYGAYVTSTTTSFSINFNSVASSGTYLFNYFIIERQ